jgi:hypothetical protein
MHADVRAENKAGGKDYAKDETDETGEETLPLFFADDGGFAAFSRSVNGKDDGQDDGQNDPRGHGDEQEGQDIAGKGRNGNDDGRTKVDEAIA